MAAVSHARCHRGALCPYLHKMVPVCQYQQSLYSETTWLRLAGDVAANTHAVPYRRGSTTTNSPTWIQHPLPALLLLLLLFLGQDPFPLSRETAPDKEAVNACLVRLSAHLSNKRPLFLLRIWRYTCADMALLRCLVLDGVLCNTVRAMRACIEQHREAGDVVVPNVVTTTFLAIQAPTCFP